MGKLVTKGRYGAPYKVWEGVKVKIGTEQWTFFDSQMKIMLKFFFFKEIKQETNFGLSYEFLGEPVGYIYLFLKTDFRIFRPSTYNTWVYSKDKV